MSAVASPPEGSQAWSRREWLPVLGALALAALWTGLGIGYEATGRVLGTASPPFVQGWLPRVDVPWLVPALAVAGALVGLGPWLVARANARTYALVVAGLAVAFVLTANAAKGGTGDWIATFNLDTREGQNEYLAAIGALSYGRELFLDRFAETVPSLAPHPAAHPPGLLLMIDVFGLGTAARISAVCLVCAGLLAPLTWLLARVAQIDEQRARLAGLAAAASPSIVLFGGTSADAIFAVLGAGAAILLALSVPDRRMGSDPFLRMGFLGAGAVLIAVAAFFAWSLLAMAAWAAIFALLTRGWRPALAISVATGTAVIALNALLWVTTGYAAIDTLRATEEIYRDSLASVRPYWFWSVGSPVAFLVTMGLPLAGALIVAALRRHPAALAIAAVIVIASVLGFSKAEVERIWIMFVPFCAIGAVLALPVRSAVRPLVGVLLLQTMLTSTLFGTLW